MKKMGIFKSSEQKQQEKNDRTEKFLKSHGITGLDPQTYSHVRELMSDNNWSAFDHIGAAFSDSTHRSIIDDLDMLTKQNWILMQQNSKIIEELQKNNK